MEGVFGKGKSSCRESVATLVYFYCCELKGLNLSSMPSTLSVSFALYQLLSLCGTYAFFLLQHAKKIFPADCKIFQQKQSKEKKQRNFRAIRLQKPAFNKEISCHFFISKCTWCANANVRIACSISHNRKQYKFTIPECKDQWEKDKNRLFFS